MGVSGFILTHACENIRSALLLRTVKICHRELGSPTNDSVIHIVVIELEPEADCLAL